MLDPENDEGNIEYKRYLINLNDSKLNSLATQMKFRIEEGNGLAIYYLGVNDNGTPYNLLKEQRKETLENFKKIVKIIDCKIDKIEFNNLYYKCIITRKQKIYDEIRVCLIGDTGSGKTTFLANILLDRCYNDNYDSRNYILNHKHEIETGKTSSININHLIFNNKRWTFLDTPGDNKYSKTKWKILLSSKPNIILNFDKKVDFLVEEYCSINNIPIFDIDIYQKYNCKEIINKKDLFDDLLKMIINIGKINKNNFKFIIFNVLKRNLESDFIVTGLLEYGTIKMYDKFKWYVNNLYYNGIIKEIYVDNMVKKISGPYIISLLVSINTNLKSLKKYKQLKQGTITNDVVIKLKTDIIGYCDNKQLNNNNNYNIDSKIIVIDNENIKKIIIL